MISFITGKPGGGKGLLSVQQVIDELRLGKRPIITNLPLCMSPWLNGRHHPMIGLQGYLLREYGKDFDCLKRVFILDDDDTACFYLWRLVKTSDGGVKLEKADANIKRVQKDGQQEERVMDFDTKLHVDSGPVLYVVDEAWKFYGSRNWQRTGEGMLFYSAQHRHFGDDVLIVTQHTKQIDPAILRVAQDFWVVTNHANLTFVWFRQPSIFVVRIYDQAPTGANLTAMSRKVFRLDKAGMAQTYDTSAGVGISGRAVADLGSRKRGLPAWGMVLVAVVSVVLLFKGFAYFPVILGHFFHGKHEHSVVKNIGETRKETVSQGGGSLPLIASPTGGEPVQKKLTGFSSGSVGDGDTNAVLCIGYVVVTERVLGVYGWTNKLHVKVFLSDGDIADSDFGEVQSITRRHVFVLGKEYEIQKKLPVVDAAVEQTPSNYQLDANNSSTYLMPSSPVVARIPQRTLEAAPLSQIHNFTGGK